MILESWTQIHSHGLAWEYQESHQKHGLVTRWIFLEVISSCLEGGLSIQATEQNTRSSRKCASTSWYGIQKPWAGKKASILELHQHKGMVILQPQSGLTCLSLEDGNSLRLKTRLLCWGNSHKEKTIAIIQKDLEEEIPKEAMKEVSSRWVIWLTNIEIE